MKLRTKIVSFGILLSLLLSPCLAASQDTSQHRQDTKNSWRNAAIVAAAIGGYGLLNNDSTLTWLGIAGAAYSANRYEIDRRSQNGPSGRFYRRRAYYQRTQVFVSYGYPAYAYPVYVPRRVHYWRHDNGRHLGWYKHGRGHGRGHEDRD